MVKRAVGPLTCQQMISMPLKTLLDCSRCRNVSRCDAHISKGTHKHWQGPDPCEIIFAEKKN
jgi:hypothetical protein